MSIAGYAFDDSGDRCSGHPDRAKFSPSHHHPDDLTCPDTLSVLTIIISLVLTASDVCITSPGPGPHYHLWPRMRRCDHRCPLTMGGPAPGAVIETSRADHTIGHISVQSQPLSREVVTLGLDERHESKQTLSQIHHHGPDISDMHHGGPGGSEGGQSGVSRLQ